MLQWAIGHCVVGKVKPLWADAAAVTISEAINNRNMVFGFLTLHDSCPIQHGPKSGLFQCRTGPEGKKGDTHEHGSPQDLQARKPSNAGFEYKTNPVTPFTAFSARMVPSVAATVLPFLFQSKDYSPLPRVI